MRVTRSRPYAYESSTITELTKTRLFLPAKLGGFSFQSCEQAARPAYIGSLSLVGTLIATILPSVPLASCNEVPALVSLQSALDHIKDKGIPLASKTSTSTIWEESAHKVQKGLKEQIDLINQKKIIAALPQGKVKSGFLCNHNMSLNELDVRAFGLAQTDPTSGPWVTAPPYGLCKMSDSLFTNMFQMRCMFNIIVDKYCPCKAPIDPIGMHTYHCKTPYYRNKFRNHSHADLCKSVRNIVRANIPSSLAEVLDEEPKVKFYFKRLSNEDLEVESRADILITDKTNSVKPLLLDVTIAHPVTSCSTQANFDKPGAAAANACHVKLREYSKKFDIKNTSEGILKILAFETTGIFSKDVVDFCRFLTQALPEDPDYAPRLCYIKQSLSVALAGILVTRLNEVRNLYSTAAPKPDDY